MRTKERATLCFDLRHCPENAEFTLTGAGGIRRMLTSYADAPDKLKEHRRRNQALACIQDGCVTHFAEDLELNSDSPSFISVVYQSKDNGSSLFHVGKLNSSFPVLR